MSGTPLRMIENCRSRHWSVPGPGSADAQGRRHAAPGRYHPLRRAGPDERWVAIARRAQRFFVGKARRAATRSRRCRFNSCSSARLPGRRVVRLVWSSDAAGKAQALQTRRHPRLDVVPGVTVRYPLRQQRGIPVTHREPRRAHSSSPEVGTMSGCSSTVHALKPGGITLVISRVDSIKSRELARNRLNAGWSEDAPAAIVYEGTLPTQQVWHTGSLDALRCHQVWQSIPARLSHRRRCRRGARRAVRSRVCGLSRQ